MSAPTPPPRRRPVIGIMGASAPTRASLEAAGRLGLLVAEAGWILLTGGRPAGVMAAANAAARRVPGSLTLGILPTGPEGPVAEHVDVAVFTGLGDVRNAVNVLTSDVVVACGVESAGAASEVALALAARRPTILLGATPEAAAFFASLAPAQPVRSVGSAEEAIQVIERDFGVPRWP